MAQQCTANRVEMEDNEDSFRPFIVKNLAAEEVEMRTDPNKVRYIEDLRFQIFMHFGVPTHVQRLVGNGRSVQPEEYEDYPIDYLLPRSDDGYKPIIWLLWMRDHDYMDIHSGAYIMADELDRKRAAAAARHQPFKPITSSGHIQLTRRFLALLKASTLSARRAAWSWL